jgi:hypothetical protein
MKNTFCVLAVVFHAESKSVADMELRIDVTPILSTRRDMAAGMSFGPPAALS